VNDPERTLNRPFFGREAGIEWWEWPLVAVCLLYNLIAGIYWLAVIGAVLFVVWQLMVG